MRNLIVGFVLGLAVSAGIVWARENSVGTGTVTSTAEHNLNGRLRLQKIFTVDLISRQWIGKANSLVS